MAKPHKPSCAARLRSLGAERQWSTERVVDEIHQCCGTSRLRSHRLARGWTLREAVAHLHQLCDDRRVDGPRSDADQWRLWETMPERRPRPSTVDLLCRLYATTPTGLGFSAGGDFGTAADIHSSHAVPATAPPAATQPPALAPQVPTADDTQADLAVPPDFETLIDSTRRLVDRTLADASVTPNQLDLIDERIMWLRQQYLTCAPKPMLRALLTELGEIHALTADRQPAAVQSRLSSMIAILSTLIADALMKLGQLRQSQAWYATARTAADDSGNVGLRARVRVQAAMLPYYYGPLETAVSLAREARLLLRHRPTATGAFAAAAEARAQARQGNAGAAEEALRQAQEIFDHTDRGREDDAFSFPERRLLLYISGALTHLGQPKRAMAVQQQALRLYPGELGIDPALLRFEEAICLAHEHCLDEAFDLAGSTYLSLPMEHRTSIVGARARNVLEATPQSMRTGRKARELGELLALPASER
ncbi:hypothetical protein [Streptomyces sp. H39-S7]|uniref:hypothetical protein n=1 Tax=Streptomyces sp. H39-S7 TaxID=3004357 RepID=UPI0022AE9BA8|nr:hypothetical protein [Streptomyces sp. H39-S7]